LRSVFRAIFRNCGHRILGQGHCTQTKPALVKLIAKSTQLMDYN